MPRSLEPWVVAVARARRTPGARANRVGERFVHALYRYLPLALGAGGIAGGLYWLVRGVGGATGDLALLLLVGAEAELAAWLGYLLWRHRRAPSADPAPRPPPVFATRAPEEPDPPSEPFSPPSETPAAPRDPVPHSGIGRAATSRFSWSGAEIWQRWRRAEAGHLGAELIPPVGDTTYFPPVGAGPHPFASRDRDLWFEHPTIPLDRAGAFSALPAPGTRTAGVGTPPSVGSPAPLPHALARGSRAGPFSPDDLDRLFPPDLAPRGANGVDGGRSGGSWIDDEESILAVLDDLPLGPVGPAGSAAASTASRSAPPTSVTDEAVRAPAPEELATGAIARPVSAIGARFPDSAPEAPPPSFSPPFGARSDSAPPEPVAVNEFPSGDLSTPWSGGSLLPDESSIDRLLYLEAMNPVPPHLRGTARPIPPTRPIPATRSTATMTCAACTRGLGDFRGWSPCIGCGRPVCRQCLHRSFLLGEEGFCWDCSGAPIS